MRRIVRGLGLGLLATVLAGCWLAPGQGPDRTGDNPFETAITPGSVAGLGWRWSVDPGDGTTSPVVHAGKVYLTANRPGGINGNLVLVNAYDVGSGAEVFSTPVVDLVPGVVYGDPFVVGDDIGTGWSYSQRRPLVVASDTPTVDAVTGALGDSVGRGPIEAVRGGYVVSTAVAATGPTMDTRSITVWTLDEAPGTWGGNLQYADPLGSPPGGVGGGLTAGFFEIFQTGPGPAGTTPGPGGYVNGVRSYSIHGGPQGCAPPGPLLQCPQWVTPMAGVLTTPVLRPDLQTLYVVENVTAGGAGGMVSGTLHALAAGSGAVLWSAPLGAGVEGSLPALADDTVFVPTGDGRVLAYPAGGCGSATCSPRRELATGTAAAIDAQPAVGGDVLFAGSGDGTVHAFATGGCGAPSCPPLWSATASSAGAGVAALAVSDGRLFVRTGDGALTTYGLP